jgi:hypothetical protein
MVADVARKRIVVGPRAARQSIASQLRALRDQAHDRLGDAPTIVGETGIPFDLRGGRAYRSGDFGVQIAAANRVMCGIEDSLSHCIWWNYTADNDNAHGDQWNGEDLSIFSMDQVSPGRHAMHHAPNASHENLDAGGRALQAIVRPYPRAIAGTLLAVRFEPLRGSFSFTFRHDPVVTAPTEIFIPQLQYPRGYRVVVSDGDWERCREHHLLLYRHTLTRAEHTVQIQRAR